MKDKFINLQLFAENGMVSEPVAQATTQQQTDLQQNANEEKKEQTVSKELFDKKTSELAELKRKLKEYEDRNKTAEQKAQDALAELEAKIAEKEKEHQEVLIKLNRANAVAELAEFKSKLSFAEKENKMFDEFVDYLVDIDSEKTGKKVTAFKGLLEQIFNKGFDMARQGSWSALSSIKTASGSANKTEYEAYLERKKETSNKIDFK